jgi:branched-chain amino acid transport system ATP-binding protein
MTQSQSQSQSQGAAVPVLEVENVSTVRGRVQVLWDVSLTVGRGETVAIVGPNGAGKTTLVGSITGLVPPKSGRIRINGEDVAGSSPEKLARRGMALVPERRGIFAPLTVRENLLMGAYARRAKTAELTRDLDDVFDLFPALVRYRDAVAGSLSGGEQQMVAIGRALMAKPDLLLLDEPSLGLAPKVRAENFGALARLAERGVTILLVEQNLRLAARICRRAYLMQRGRIVGTETSDELARSARRVYLESHG